MSASPCPRPEQPPCTRRLRFLRLLGALCLSVAGPATADMPFAESPRLVLQAIAQGRTVHGQASAGQVGVMAIAVPYRLAADDCISIGLIRVAAALTENWRLCGNRLERLPGISPQFSPAHPQMREVVDWAIREAVTVGQKQTGWGDYDILARRLPEADARGCPQVESLVLLDGLLVSRQLAAACP